MSNVLHEGINICNEVCGVTNSGRGGTAALDSEHLNIKQPHTLNGTYKCHLKPYLEAAVLLRLSGRRCKSSPLTKLVSSGEGRWEAVIFNYRTAPLWVTHGADVCHAKSVTG